jgi:microsomal dipeptidase-like Zn-dependent dipeptidase
MTKLCGPMAAGALVAGLIAGGCGGSDPELVYDLADACMEVVEAPGDDRARSLAARGTSFAFTDSGAARFFLKASDLGTYLFYDAERHYLAADGDALLRTAHLDPAATLLDDDHDPGVEWVVEVAGDDGRVRLRHLASGRYLGARRLVSRAGRAAELTLRPAAGCAEHPELTVDAEGSVQVTEIDDGSVFGIVDTHSHLLSNLAFGGGIFHGAPFHRLGVQHALPDCEVNHGPEGRRDLFGYVFDHGSADADTLLNGVVTGETPEFNHHTAGYPDFAGWPRAPFSSTHQTQYYRWLERAYLGGLRLVVQHATSNQVICELMVGTGSQQARYSCNDMEAVDRIIAATHDMERYIDAQHGGPGQGWFRIVTSPEQAREVIRGGKMAVILGIEVSNLFDCFLVPPFGMPACDEAHVHEQLDHYYDLGVRAIFPVHKYDNAFSAGDGDRLIMELANVIQTGHYLNFVEDCPDLPSVFDRGNVTFSSLNRPRDDYFGAPYFDFSELAEAPVRALLPLLTDVTDPEPLVGDYCQNAGLQPLGEYLMQQMMQRGMIIEIDHLPRRSYERAFEMLHSSDYPAAGTHGNNNRGALYALGGISKANLGRCQDPNQPGTMADGLRRRVELIRERGGYPAEGFGFDLNGFAGAPGPRFGADSGCPQPQENPVTYPFTSFAGDVTFHEPRVGNRTIDFNTEGLVHIGLLPELIEDARRDGVTDEELEPLFRSAEAYLRMWERSIDRGAALRQR